MPVLWHAQKDALQPALPGSGLTCSGSRAIPTGNGPSMLLSDRRMTLSPAQALSCRQGLEASHADGAATWGQPSCSRRL